jgi:hypothetical protein
VGNVSKAGKKKGNWVRVGKKIKFPKKKLRSGLRKDKQKKLNLEWHMDRKENPISAPSIHPSWCTGGCWFTVAAFFAGF